MADLDQVREVFERVAAEHAGVVGVGPDGPGGASLRLSLDGADVLVTAAVATGDLRIEAPAPGAGDLDLRLYPERLSSQLGKLFGAQDVQVGESRFDERFMIKASDESLARLWLGLEVRAAIGDAHPEGAEGAFAVDLRAERVRLAWTTTSVGARRITAGIRAAVAISRRASTLLTEHRGVVEKLGGVVTAAVDHWSVGPEVVARFDLDGVEVRLWHDSRAFLSRAPEVFTRIETSRTSRACGRWLATKLDAQRRAKKLLGQGFELCSEIGADLSFGYWVGAEHPAALAARLSPDDEKAIVDARPTVLFAGDDEVTIWLVGLVTDAVHLGRALRAVARLAGDHRDEGPTLDARRRVAGSSRARARTPLARARGETAQRSVLDHSASLWDVWKAAGLPGEAIGDLVTGEIDFVRFKAHESFVTDETTGEVEPYQLTIDATVPPAWGLELALREGSLGALSFVLGAQDVEIGDDRFDEHYIIKTTDPGYAKLWLDSRLRGLIAETRDPRASMGYGFELRGAKLVVTRSVERDPRRLARAMDALCALARRPYDVLESLRSLAASVGGELFGDSTTWRPDGSVSIAIDHGVSATTIDHVREELFDKTKLLRTRVRRGSPVEVGTFVVCRRDRKKRVRRLLDGKLEERGTGDSNFDLLYWCGWRDPEAASLDERLLGRLVLMEPDALVVDGQELTVWFTGWVDDEDRLRRAIDVLDGLAGTTQAAGPAGPYR